MLGERVFEGAFRQNLEVGHLSPGLYIVRITDPAGQTITSSKLIKQ
jgi:hypothetical protein